MSTLLVQTTIVIIFTMIVYPLYTVIYLVSSCIDPCGFHVYPCRHPSWKGPLPSGTKPASMFSTVAMLLAKTFGTLAINLDRGRRNIQTGFALASCSTPHPSDLL